ncbi:MAG: autotransporter-associated beta strand repeat-containing protein [Thermoguttaceae bacterium]|jgi:autotransporter-associated beta strand protein
MGKLSKPVFCLICLLLQSESIRADVSVNASVDVNTILRTMPNSAIGINLSVYSNQFGNNGDSDWYTLNPTMPALVNNSGAEMIRYPGGSYSDGYHFSTHKGYGEYCATGTNMGNFVRLLDQSSSLGMITIDYGSAMKSNGTSAPDYGGQPQEAAAWVAYANGNASLFGTPNDISLGVDQQGNNWKTVGYWAKLRASTSVQYQSWATAAGLYNANNAFLAVNRAAPIGIKYWEIGNEIGGNGYTYPGYWADWETDYHAQYTNPVYDSQGNPHYPNRIGDSRLSPTAYATNLIQFATAMKAVDPTIKIGAGLDGSRTTANRNILQTAGNYIDFGIVHWYTDSSPYSTLFNAPRQSLPSQVSAVRQDFAAYTNKGPNDYEIHFTEFGTWTDTADPYATAIFAADAYGTGMEQAGVGSMDWWEMSKNTYLSDSYSNQTIGAAYKAIQMYSQIAVAGSNVLQSTSSNTLARIHSTRLDDGSVAIMLININSDTVAQPNDVVTVSINDANLLTKGAKWIYGASQDTPLKTIQTSGLGGNFSITVPYGDIITLIIPEHLSWTGTGSNTNWVDANGTNWKYDITANGNGDPAVFSSDAHETFTVNVNGPVTVGKLTTDGLGGATQWNFSGSGNITLQGAGAPIIESDVNTVINVPISGAQGLRKTGNAQLVLSGSLNYTGQTIVDAGTLQINKIGAVSLADINGAGALGVGDGANATSLSANSVSVSVLTIAAGSTLIINPIPGGPLSGSLTALPEPGTLTLLGIGSVMILFGYARRR